MYSILNFTQYISILQIYWLLQGLSYFSLILKSIFTGKYWNKAEHLTDTCKQSAWWHFKKRVALFYVVGIVTTVYLTYSTLKSCFGWTSCYWVQNLRHEVTKPSQPQVDSTSCVVGSLIYLTHLMCRLHQTIFVSVHSWKQVLGPVWVVIIYVNQIASAISLVAEGPLFDGTSFDCFSVRNLKLQHILAVLLFTSASYIQYQSFDYLTSLRKNKAGHIVTTSYKPPKFGIFQQLNVSSPHYFAEIIAHLSVLVALGTNCHTWMVLTYCVACHMTYLAYVTHQYYLDKFFEDYSKKRNILIPFLI